MDDIEELVQKIYSLNIQQQQLVTDLVDEISASNQLSPQPPRHCNNNFRSSNGTSLTIGDKVKILSSRKTGKYGDTAVIIKFNKTLVAIELEENKSRTQRASKYLELL